MDPSDPPISESQPWDHHPLHDP
ncbi:uncharacterized protein G2W53_030433 [Senna tora]|uniref:Uncharacterized protein n=1 Tax=Senna tora TaxID=362788 RepID=A0A834TFL6_9FABA|nr:uncharacterized protein G2W53_030433 [Senna tora]